MRLESVASDPFNGYQHKPSTLNKYAYVGNDPANMIDPMGMMSLAETSIAGDLQSTLTSISLRMGSLLNAYDKINAVIGFAELINIARQVFGGATEFTDDDAKSSENLGGINFKDAMESAAMNMPRAIGTGIGAWSNGYVASKRKQAKLTGALIYMPLVSSLGVKAPPLKTPAKNRFGNEKIPVKLMFGALLLRLEP